MAAGKRKATTKQVIAPAILDEQRDELEAPVAARSGQPIATRLAKAVWRRILGLPATEMASSDGVERPGPRGWVGRGRGEAAVVDLAREYRGTTSQVCGLYPFGNGTSVPAIGVPLGQSLLTGATVCGDPISYFRGGLIRNPSMFVLGLPGLGKSTLMRRMLLGSAAFGTIPLVLGDFRPDYVQLIKQLGGDVIPLGPGRGSLNPLDNAEVLAAARRLPEDRAKELLASSRSRRVAVLEALVSIQRSGSGGVVLDHENTILSEAVRILDNKQVVNPLIGDLLDLIRSRPAELQEAVVDRGRAERYLEKTEDLEASLHGIITGSRLGDGTFARETSMPMRRDRACVIDLSGIGEEDALLRAAALMASWSAGFGTVAISTALAEAGVEPRRHYLLALDEIHQALRSGPRMVERYDRLSRLNRASGVGQILCTHTMADLDALPTVEDRAKARGLVERAGMQMFGGLPSAEMGMLNEAVRLSVAEQSMLTSWNEPGSLDPETGTEATPPGQGNFLLKIGGRSGTPFNVRLTRTEHEGRIHRTNEKWESASRIGTSAIEQVA